MRFTCPDNREWMSIMTCINAVGNHIPNLYIFKRKTRPQIDYIKQSEVGAAMTYQENGYMTSEIFLEWLVYFKNNVLGGMSKDNQHLLILDGHISHVTNEAINFGRENGLDILTLPSHCSYKLQPLDVAVFHPFKLNLAVEKMDKMRSNPQWAQGATMKTMLAEMSSRALAKALKPENIRSGFVTTGIYSIDTIAMDSRFGPNTTHEEIRGPEEHNTQEDPTVMEIFSTMKQPLVLTPIPNLFPELDVCIPSEVAGSNSANEIVQSLSQLSLAAHSNTLVQSSQQFSPVYETPNCSR